jgi:restriction system protein
MTKVPTFDRLMNPLITALRDLGGSGSIDEIYERVIQNLKLSEDILSVLHDPEASNQTEVHYRLAWARTYLKKYGVLTNSARGIWTLTKPDLKTVDPKTVVKTVREHDKEEKQAKTSLGIPPVAEETEEPDEA